MATAAGRQQFASTAVNFVKDLGLDGIDIDWEYPASSADAQNFVSLLQTLRSVSLSPVTNLRQLIFL